MIRDVLVHPNKLLRRRSRELANLDGLSELVTDATDTMLALNASSIALVQIGVPLRVVTLNCTGGRTVTLFNPRIVFTAGKVIARETCPSLPGQEVKVERYEFIRVEHLRPHGLETFEAYEPLLAVAIQHEVDHLNGVLTLDRDATIRPSAIH